MPFERLPDEDEHAVAWLDASFGQPVRPLSGAGVDLGEAQLAPLTTRRDERDRVPGSRLDDVPGEVEPLGDVPGEAHGKAFQRSR